MPSLLCPRRRALGRTLVAVALAALALATIAIGDESRDSAAAPDYLAEIQPLLAARCVRCHGPEKQKGGLRLDLKASALAGGDSGDPAVLPGQPDASRLLQVVASTDDAERMPPEGEPLAAGEIDVLRRWIESGANWPEDSVAAPTPSEMVVTDEDRNHWSFRPLCDVELPKVADDGWIRTPVDRFIRHA